MDKVVFKLQDLVSGSSLTLHMENVNVDQRSRYASPIK